MNNIAGIPYIDVHFDREGKTQDSVTLPQGCTDLFVVSHGWNNNQQEAEALYKDLFQNLASVAPAKLRERKLAILGIIWPSKKFTELVEAAVQQGGAAGFAARTVPNDTISLKLDLLAEMFGPTAAINIQNAKKLIGKLETDPAAQDEFVKLLVGLVDPRAADKEDASDKLFSMKGSLMLDKLQVPTPLAPSTARGGGGATGMVEGVQQTPQGGGAAGLGDTFTGIRAGATRLINFLTYYEMKALAGTVGQSLGKLIDQLPSSGLRIHLIGHSFGGRLVSAAAMASSTPSLSSMSLLQAAFSHNSFSSNFDNSSPPRPGSFRNVVAQARIKGPILVTYTPNDLAVGIMYPLASRLGGTVASAYGDKDDKYGGIGRNGVQKMKSSELGSSAQVLLPVNSSYQWEPGKFHNLESSKFIKNPAGGDAHMFVTGKEIAWAISSAVT